MFQEGREKEEEEGGGGGIICVYSKMFLLHTHTHTHARTRAGPCPDAHSAILLTYNLTYLRIS